MSCLLLAVCCLLFILCCRLLLVVCCVLVVACCLLFVDWRLGVGIWFRCLLIVVRCGCSLLAV